jgi:ribosomal protein L24E
MMYVSNYQSIIQQCSEKCLGTSGSRLEPKEQKCVSNCYDRYIDTRKVVMREAQSD